MPDETYNGWTNRATWLMSMYLDGNYDGEGTYLDACALVDFASNTGTDECEHVFRLAESLENYARDRVGNLGGIVNDLFNVTFNEINWREIATNMLAES